MKFGWDQGKADENLKVHRVTFEEAQEVFRDPKAMDFLDPVHSRPEERRYNIIGFSSRRLLFVAYAELPDRTIWLVSARKAEAKYRRLYEEENRP